MEISEAQLLGREVVDVSGLVVAPGFIDLHVHGTSIQAQEFQVHDGVTTALELEWGRAYLRQWLASRTGASLINFGASVQHAWLRWTAMDEYAVQAEEARRIVEAKGPSDQYVDSIYAAVAPSQYRPPPGPA